MKQGEGFPERTTILIQLLVILIVVLAPLFHASTVQAQTGLGAKYCGGISKKYGIVGTAANTTYQRTISKYYYIRITGIIDVSTEEYVQYALQKAEADNAALILLINTPGGYLDPATNIVAMIDHSSVPVIGYVVDKWAESAGALILLSTDIAAMQPGTIIGSMQPVIYNPQTGTYKPVNESKIINPIIQLLCEHAATKGRNATQLVRFVLYNDNLGAEQALKRGVIDYVAPSLQDLLEDVNGVVVALPSGDTVRLLVPPGSQVYEIPPPPRVVIVHALSDPLLSGVLLSLGTLIIIFSIISGHLAFATIGALLLLLGLAGSGYSPNMVSVLLIILGALLLAVEMHTPSFGLLGGVGIVMIVLGIALLPSGGGFSVPQSYAYTLLAALYATGAIVGGLTAFIVYKVIQVKRKKPIIWTIIGSTGIADDEISPDKPGFVIIEGEYWKATSRTRIRKGEKVRVVGKDGPLLIVEPLREDERGQG